MARSASGSSQDLSTTDDVTSVTDPGCPAAGSCATRPGLCARCGSKPASVTAPGHRCWPGPVPPARTSPSRVAGWLLTADCFCSAGPAGRAPPALILGVSWAACWCGGLQERTYAVEPAVSQLGSSSRSELPGHCYRVWTSSGADSDEAVSLDFATQAATRAGPVGLVRQSQSSAEVGDVSDSPVSQALARALPSRRQSQWAPASAGQTSWTGRLACPRSVVRLAPLLGDDPSLAGRCAHWRGRPDSTPTRMLGRPRRPAGARTWSVVPSGIVRCRMYSVLTCTGLVRTMR